jgi:prepilin-type N-terminal cleavage/methylation domain-containing protein
MSHSCNSKAFSLIEVVIALAIVVYVGFALIGLIGIGLKASGDSRRQLQAATIAEAICSTRRAAPTNDFTSGAGPQPGFPLPALTQSADDFGSPVYLTPGGTLTTLAKGDAQFGLFYKIVAPANYTASISPGVSSVYICLYWPAAAAPSTPNLAHFEVTTTFALP